MGFWERLRGRKSDRAARARYDRFVDQVPAGMVLLCGRTVGVDVPVDQVRRHLERDCKPQREGGLCCVELVRR